MDVRTLSRSSFDSLIVAVGLIVVALLLVPYASNGFWFDDALNSQIYPFLHRIHGGLGEFSYRVVKHWLQDEGRLMLAFFYGYPGFYLFNDLGSLRLAHCILIVVNIALYGYLLWLWGVTTRFLTIWGIVLVGLFQIHGRGLDPVAGFAFHYPMLGIQLTIVLLLFTKWQQGGQTKFLYWSLGSWLLFMSFYETNFIFIPIAFAMMFLIGGANKKFPGLLLVSAACIYLAFTFYLKSQVTGASYAGSSFGEPSKMLLAYFKQLSASLPFASYIAVTHHSLSFAMLIKDAIGSVLAWVVFVLSLIIILSYTTLKPSARAVKSGALILSLGMFLLPAIFPAISQRYQNEVGWGIGTLPVYYQNFGLAFFVAWAISFIPDKGAYRLALPILISFYLALNVTLNSGMANIIDSIWREPRDAFAAQSQAGLFSAVKDGDVIHLKNVNNYINSNLIFEWSGKRVFIPSDDHYWYPETSANSARNFELSRDTAGRYQLVEILESSGLSAGLTLPPEEILKNKVTYQFIAPQPGIVNVLDNFPPALPLIEIQIGLSESSRLDSVYVSAPNALGEWTTQPNANLWSVGVIEKAEGYKIRNPGSRKEKLNLPVKGNLILWIPDNGSLAKCPELHVDLVLVGGKRISTTANCNGH